MYTEIMSIGTMAEPECILPGKGAGHGDDPGDLEEESAPFVGLFPD